MFYYLIVLLSVKSADQFSKINLSMVFRIIAVSITARPGLDYRWDFENYDRESVLWNRILTLYIAIKAYQISFYKMFYLVKYQYLNKRRINL
jgi:hypothetical protein